MLGKLKVFGCILNIWKFVQSKVFLYPPDTSQLNSRANNNDKRRTTPMKTEVKICYMIQKRNSSIITLLTVLIGSIFRKTQSDECSMLLRMHIRILHSSVFRLKNRKKV
ncbi:hypothetical protein AQUCO_12300017v1 [Aquilegia coerulea]|uniref:Uncharacterized protein n=1 Tax=Aquilegia coerulea TaxID=218851 RepID=A0A2G5C1P9_AQUCA|nr:hypothetical protein AQUCO_12300017v1 [Aquilegia coerulea]